ncbi:sigma factor-like helix-turn-helix DNA-binding protein, partial [Leptospira sp. 96542]|nr:sigma factor-like helix-turn-helix DNA-binding protein [Leptospira sp. 96542]
VQDAYVRALEAQELHLNVAQAWLLTVMRNIALDRLRRRQWLQQWLAEQNADDGARTGPSAESEAALAQDAERALRLLAAHLTPADAAVVLLHEVFEADHADIARGSGKTETACRQQLRRALLRLRRAAQTEPAPPESESSQEVVFRTCLQSLRMHDPRILWAMLRQPPITAQVGSGGLPRAATEATSAPRPRTGAAVAQVGGQLGLVLTLDGVTLCVLPLGARNAHEMLNHDAA